jgi:hypothetical protein
LREFAAIDHLKCGRTQVRGQKREAGGSGKRDGFAIGNMGKQKTRLT